jgi:hypothetical protein
LPLPHEEGDPANPDFARLLKGTLKRTPGQSASVQFKRYDVIHNTSGGGGGWGDPLERSPEMVVQELNEGLTFPKTAETVYGVATKKTDDGLLALDAEKTAALREKIRKNRLKKAVPTKEYLAKARKDVVEGDFVPVVKEMYNNCFNNSPRFLREYREFWNLPDTFVGF